MGHLYRQRGNLRRAALWYRKATVASFTDADVYIFLGSETQTGFDVSFLRGAQGAPLTRALSVSFSGNWCHRFQRLLAGRLEPLVPPRLVLARDPNPRRVAPSVDPARPLMPGTSRAWHDCATIAICPRLREVATPQEPPSKYAIRTGIYRARLF